PSPGRGGDGRSEGRRRGEARREERGLERYGEREAEDQPAGERAAVAPPPPHEDPEGGEPADQPEVVGAELERGREELRVEPEEGRAPRPHARAEEAAADQAGEEQRGGEQGEHRE